MLCIDIVQTIGSSCDVGTTKESGLDGTSGVDEASSLLQLLQPIATASNNMNTAIRIVVPVIGSTTDDTPEHCYVAKVTYEAEDAISTTTNNSQ